MIWVLCRSWVDFGFLGYGFVEVELILDFCGFVEVEWILDLLGCGLVEVE